MADDKKPDLGKGLDAPPVWLDEIADFDYVEARDYGLKRFDDRVWFFNADSFKLPKVGETTTVPLVYYNGRQRIVIGEATFRPDGQVECKFGDELQAEVVQALALRNYPMSFSIDRAELEDLRAPLWRGKSFSSIGDEERRTIDKILKLEVPPAIPKDKGEASHGTAD